MSIVKRFIKEKYLFFLAFSLPVLIIAGVFWVKGIYPFGNNTIIVSDMNLQYVNFIKGLQNKINGKNFGDFSWNIGLGTNYYAIFVYYLLSPIYLLLSLWKWNMMIFIEVIIGIKIALSSLSFFFFLSRKYKEKNILMLIVSICYSLSAYIITYGFINIIWLDALIIFPILILSLERMFYEKKCGLYYFFLSLTIICNYYFAIIICVFCAFYFLGLYFSDYKNLKNNILKIKNFVVYSLLAGLTGAFVYIPAYYNLKTTISTKDNINEYFYDSFLWKISSPIEIMGRMLIDVNKTTKDFYPNIYCSILVLVVFFIYILNKKIEIEDKIRNIMLLLTVLLSFYVKSIYFLCNGMHYPNGFVHRYSFVFIFIILIMTYEGLRNIDGVKEGKFYILLLFPLTYIFLIWKFVDKSSVIKEKNIILSLFFVVLYGILLYLLFNLKKFKFIVKVVLLLIVCFEMFLNSKTTISCNKNNYIYMENVDLNSMLQNDEIRSIYRTYMDYDVKDLYPNNAEFYNYYGGNIFSSTTNFDVFDFYNKFGLMSTVNGYTLKGNDNFIRSLFNIKYIISTPRLNYPKKINIKGKKTKIWMLYKYACENDFENANDVKKISDSFNISEYMESMLYENKYPFSIGFCVDKKNISLSDNIFENRNELYKTISGEEDELYTRAKYKTNAPLFRWDLDDELYSPYKYKTENVNFNGYDSDNYYIYELDIQDEKNICIQCGYSYYFDIKMNYRIEGEDGYEYDGYQYFTDNTMTIDNLKKNDKLYISIPKKVVRKVDIYVDNNVSMEKCYNKIKEGFLNVSYYDNNEIRGSITAKKDSYMFTSIPYDTGWTVYVDNKKVKTEKIYNTFISVPLDKGKHNIVMKYEAPGKKIGIVISLISLILTVIITFYKKQKKHN